MGIPAIEDWLLGEGLKVSKLPTLVLIKGGVPLRALAGKLPILDEASLQGFALDGGFVPHSAVVPTRGVVKHAHDGTVVPTANPNPKPNPSADAFVGLGLGLGLTLRVRLRVRVRIRSMPLDLRGSGLDCARGAGSLLHDGACTLVM